MTNETSKPKHLIGGSLTVLEDEAMIVIAEIMAADGHGTGAVAETLHHK